MCYGQILKGFPRIATKILFSCCSVDLLESCLLFLLQLDTDNRLTRHNHTIGTLLIWFHLMVSVYSKTNKTNIEADKKDLDQGPVVQN